MGPLGRVITPLIEGEKKPQLPHLFSAIYRDYCITPFGTGDGAHLVGWDWYTNLPLKKSTILIFMQVKIRKSHGSCGEKCFSFRLG